MNMDTTVALYPGPDGIEPSPLYMVKVNGQPMFVYPVTVGDIVDPVTGQTDNDPPETTSPRPAAFCYFDFSGGPVEIEVTVKPIETRPTVESVVVRPSRHGILPELKNGTCRFTLAEPAKLSIEPNGNVWAPLFIFAGRPDPAPPAEDDPTITRYFGPGIHVAGIIEPKSNENIYLAAGAVVYGQLNLQKAENVRIFGRGILDASKAPRKGDTPSSNEYGQHAPLAKVHFCNNIRIEGIHLIDSPGWSMQVVQSVDVRIDDVRLVNWRENGDGIDIVSCEQVRVTDCFLRTWDDALLVKGLTDLLYPQLERGGWSPAGVRKPCRDVAFERCVVWTDRAQVLHVGLETRTTEICDIVWRDIDVIHAFHLGLCSIRNGDAAHVHDLLFENIRVEDARCRFLLEIATEETYVTADDRRGPIDRIVFRNIDVTAEEIPPSDIRAENAAARIADVRFENIRFNGKLITNAAGLDLTVGSHVENVCFAPQVEMRAMETVDDMAVALLRTPAGIAFAMLPPQAGGPASTLLLFAMAGAATLTTEPYCRVGRLLYAQGWNVVSLDLPCHGADLRPGEPPELAGWAARVGAGEDIVAPFRQRVNDVVEHLVATDIADPSRIAAAGTSRGGFMAFHAAAGNPSIRAVAAFSPVTDLLALSEFAGQEANPLVRRLALTKAADNLADRAAWITIGDADERVGTDKAVEFASALPQAMLQVVATPGHSSASEWHDKAAEWMATVCGRKK
jgi:pimeloyl-ACP methyl ester carboxylesterase